MFRILSRITSNHGVTCIAAQHDHVTVTLARALAEELADALEQHLPFTGTIHGGSVIVLISPVEPTDELRLLWYAPESLEPITLWRLTDTPSHHSLLAQALRDPMRTGDVTLGLFGTLTSGNIRLKFDVTLGQLLRVAADPSDASRWVTGDASGEPSDLWGEERWAGSPSAGWEAVLACTSAGGLRYDVGFTWEDLEAAQDQAEGQVHFIGFPGPCERAELNARIARNRAADRVSALGTWRSPS
jgi:hypothetical protein